MSLFTDYNANDLPETNTTGVKTKVVKIKEEPIICKLVPILNMKDASNKPLLYYPYSRFTFSFVKDGKRVNYSRPSLKVLGEDDPQFNLYLEMRAQLKKMDKKSAEYKDLDEKSKAHKPTRKGILFVHVLGSNDIQAMEVPESILNKLFGQEAWESRPAEEGLYPSLRRAKNINIFDVMANNNWLKLYRTGTDFYTTKYHVEQYKVSKIVDGEEVDAVFRQEVSPSLKELKDTDLPNAVTIASEYSWTGPEVVKYLGTGLVPDKVHGKKAAEAAQAAVAAANQATTGNVTDPQQAQVQSTAPVTQSQQVAPSVGQSTTQQTSSFADSFENVFR